MYWIIILTLNSFERIIILIFKAVVLGELTLIRFAAERFDAALGFFSVKCEAAASERLLLA